MGIGKFLYRMTSIGSVLSFIGMMVCVVIQVCSRFLMDNAPSWTEELSRFFFIYGVSFGLGLSFRHGTIIKLDILQRFVSKRVNDTIELFINVMIAGFGFFMTIYALRFASIGMNEKSPALEINMLFAFAAIPVMMMVIFSSALLQIIHHFKRVAA